MKRGNAEDAEQRGGPRKDDTDKKKSVSQLDASKRQNLGQTVSELMWGEFEALDTNCTRSGCCGNRDRIHGRRDALAVHAGECRGGTRAEVRKSRRHQELSLKLFSAELRRRRRDDSQKYTPRCDADRDRRAAHHR